MLFTLPYAVNMTETAARLPRRERVRQATVEEIKAVARAQMAAEGTAGVNLRAIAREMGMTAPALYRYFGSRDDLVTALVTDAYDALADAMEAAVAAVAAGRHADRVRAAFGAFRAWGLEHPTEFALIFGSPIPGYVAPEATRPAGTRYTGLLAGLLVEAHAAGALDPAGIDLRVPAELRAPARGPAAPRRLPRRAGPGGRLRPERLDPPPRPGHPGGLRPPGPGRRRRRRPVRAGAGRDHPPVGPARLTPRVPVRTC